MCMWSSSSSSTEIGANASTWCHWPLFSRKKRKFYTAPKYVGSFVPLSPELSSVVAYLLTGMLPSFPSTELLILSYPFNCLCEVEWFRGNGTCWCTNLWTVGCPYLKALSLFDLLVSDFGQNKEFLALWYRKTTLYLISDLMLVTIMSFCGRAGHFEQEDQLGKRRWLNNFPVYYLSKRRNVWGLTEDILNSDMKNKKIWFQQVWGRLLRKARLFCTLQNHLESALLLLQDFPVTILLRQVNILHLLNLVCRGQVCIQRRCIRMPGCAVSYLVTQLCVAISQWKAAETVSAAAISKWCSD